MDFGEFEFSAGNSLLRNNRHVMKKEPAIDIIDVDDEINEYFLADVIIPEVSLDSNASRTKDMNKIITNREIKDESEIVNIDDNMDDDITESTDENLSFVCVNCEFICTEESVFDAHSMEMHSKITVNDSSSSNDLDSEIQAARGHPCPICGKQLKQKRNLLIHTSRHNNEYPFSCRICSRGYSNHSRLMEHQRIHTGEKPYACDECPMQFSYRSSLYRHKKTHSSEERFECAVCLKRLASKETLKHHISIHDDTKPYSCHHCPKSFREKRQLYNHINKYHNFSGSLHNDNGVIFPCDECQMEFTNVKSLNLHKQNHARGARFRCAICSTDFSIRYQFMEHMNSHNGILFQCEHCFRKFQKLGNLKTHQRIHHKHETNHTQPNEVSNDFNCNSCDKSFHTNASLRRHMKIHSTQNQYIHCDICNKQIKNTYFNFHIKIHLGQKSFKCGICAKSFQKRARLELHKKSHLNEAAMQIKPEIISLD